MTGLDRVSFIVHGVFGAGLLAAVATLFLPAPSGLVGHRELVFAFGYAAVFLFAQRAGFLLHWRGHATKVSVEEFALVGGLLLLPPPTFVAAVVAGAIANQILTRRALVKAAFNVGQYSLAASGAAATFVLLATLGVPLLWATVPAPFVFSMISQGSTALLFSRLEGEHPLRVFRDRFLAWSLIAATIGLSLGLAAWAMWTIHPALVLAVLPIFLLLARFGRLTEWAEEELRVSQALAEATTASVTSAADFDHVARALTNTCASIFGAGEVRLRLAFTPGEPPREWSWRHESGAGSSFMRAELPSISGDPGEILVSPRPGQRHYAARERHLLALVAAAASSAARGHRSILELRETNRRLTNANRELEEFTLWTTHDMREPLRSVSQLATILHDDLDLLEPTEAKELARKIERGAATLKDRIKALHEFSRIVQEDAPYETVDLEEVWDETREGLAARIGESGARVQVSGELPRVRGQRARLQKVFANLLENALKYNDKPMPDVELRARDAGDAWELVLRDNGPGIDPSFRERAFKLFQRGPSSAGARGEGGSGAGLAIVKRIVEQHGGNVWIDDASGGGAEIWVRLPKEKVVAAREIAVVA